MQVGHDPVRWAGVGVLGDDDGARIVEVVPSLSPSILCEMALSSMLNSRLDPDFALDPGLGRDLDCEWMIAHERTLTVLPRWLVLIGDP